MFSLSHFWVLLIKKEFSVVCDCCCYMRTENITVCRLCKQGNLKKGPNCRCKEKEAALNDLLTQNTKLTERRARPGTKKSKRKAQIQKSKDSKAQGQNRAEHLSTAFYFVLLLPQDKPVQTYLTPHGAP